MYMYAIVFMYAYLFFFTHKNSSLYLSSPSSHNPWSSISRGANGWMMERLARDKILFHSQKSWTWVTMCTIKWLPRNPRKVYLGVANSSSLGNGLSAATSCTPQCVRECQICIWSTWLMKTACYSKWWPFYPFIIFMINW